MRTITLDLERMTSVPALHKYLRSALALPAHYGANLDALYDCLTEIVEPTQIIVPADKSKEDEPPRPVLRIPISLLPVKFRFPLLRPAKPAAAARHTSPAFHCR